MKKTTNSNPLKYFNDEKAERVAKLTKAQNGIQKSPAEKELEKEGYTKDNKRAVEFNYTNNPSDTNKVNYWFGPTGEYAGPLTGKEVKKVNTSKKKK
jgi:hypothetical protein